MRLIDADLLGLTDMEIIMCDGDYKEALKILIDKIEHAPTIEPQQTCEYWDSESKFCALCRPSAQPRTGKWIHIRTEEDGNALYECSECHMGEVHVPIVDVKYCWNCGAKMEG